MRVGSLFAGVGGFDLGFERAGMTTAWQVECDPHCLAVLERHFPSAQRHDDVRTVGAHNLDPVDVICGGFPCQDLSVAGKRSGLAGERSGLFYRMVEVIGAIRPVWVVCENVPGLLSSHGGRDFLSVMRAFDGIGYAGAWTILDARYFGVAQRRRRIFGVLTRLDSGAERAASVLALSARLRGNPAPRREAGEDVAGTLGGGAPGRGRRDNPDSSGAFVPGYALRSDPGGTGQGHNTNYVTPALQAGSPTYERGDGSLLSEDASLTLSANGNDQTLFAAGVRRLTPTECERLQGFPDGWTEGQADSHRYRQMGNAVAVPCAEWIGRRMMAHMAAAIRALAGEDA